MFHLTPVVVAMVNASVVDEVDEPFSIYTVMFNIYLDNILKYRRLPTLLFFSGFHVKKFQANQCQKIPK